MQIGIDSFAAAYDDASRAMSASDRLRNLVEQIEHADQVGLDVFGIGDDANDFEVFVAARSGAHSDPFADGAIVAEKIARSFLGR